MTAVVGSSPGAPISSPYHFSSHNFYGEGPDAGQAGHWWIHDILNYSAHPERLPMDGNGVLGLIVPRACAVADGWTDKEGSISFAAEMNILASAEVHETIYGPGSTKKVCQRNFGRLSQSRDVELWMFVDGMLIPSLFLLFCCPDTPHPPPRCPPWL